MAENSVALKENVIIANDIINEEKYGNNRQLSETNKKLYLAMFNITFTSEHYKKDATNLSMNPDEATLTFNKIEVVLTSFSGPIDDTNIQKVTGLIHSSLSENLRSIIFDLEKLTYINCRGLNAIISLTNQPYLGSVKFFFIKTPENILRLLKLVGFNKIYKFHHTLKEALNELDFNQNSKHEITELARYLNSYQCTNCDQIFSITSKDNGVCPEC